MTGRLLALFPDGWPHRARALAPLYGAVWLAVVCAFVAIGAVLDDERFTLTSLAMTTLGFAASLAMRLMGASRRVVPVLLAAAAAALAVLDRTHSLGLLPIGAGAIVASILPAFILTWFLAIFSFCLVDDDLLLFMVPPSLAILGLAGTENPNPDMMVYFLVFVVAAMFAASYQSYIQHMPLEQVGRSGASLRPVLRWQLANAAVLFTLVAILSAVVSLPLKDVSHVHLRRLGVPGSPLWSMLAGLGYQAMGRELRIGQGSPPLSTRPVMRVQSPRPLLWRARTYDEYTGRGWVDNAVSRSLIVSHDPVGGKWVAQIGLAESRSEDRERVYQRFTFEGAWPSQALPAAADPVTMVFDGLPGDLRVTEGGTVLSGMMQVRAGTAYEATSLVVAAPPERLRRVPDGSVDRAALEPFLRVPNSAWRLQREAQRATRGLANNYDRVLAIIEYLRRTCSYNLDVPSVPQGEDGVTYFVLRAREGYCDMFASAMAVMCRMVGIPTRLATGFASGEYDQETRAYQVCDLDAHAWVEVYFPGVGWVTFDPTPGSREDVLGALRRGRILLVLRRLLRPTSFPLVLAVGVALLSLHLVRLSYLDPWRRTRALLRSAGPGPRGDVLRAYYQAHQALARYVPARPSQTPLEYCREVAQRAPNAPWLADLEVVTRAFLAARFGSGPVPQSVAAGCRQHLARVLEGVAALRPSKRGPRSAG